MSEFLNSVGRSWGEYFGLAVIQNTLFLGLVFLALYILRRAPARVRYTVCVVGLIKLLLPPFLPFRNFFTDLVPAESMAGFIQLVAQEPVASTAAIPITSAAHLDIWGVLFTGWIVVVAVILTGSLICTLRLKRVLKDAAAEPTLQARELTGDSSISIYVSEHLGMPLTLGLLPRKIYVPKAWQGWDAERRSLVIRHEMAHIKRFDGFFQALQILAQALYFFHPLVHLLGRRMTDLREMACDDAVIQHNEKRALGYTRCLVEIAEEMKREPWACESASALYRRRNELLNRVSYLMSGGGSRAMSRMSRISRMKMLSIVLALVLLMVPLSWYQGTVSSAISQAALTGAAQDEAKSAEKTTQTDQEQVRKKEKAHGDYQTIDVQLVSSSAVMINGQKTKTKQFTPVMQGLVGDHPENVIVKLGCDESVTMGTLNSVQRQLQKMELMKIKYVNEDGKGMKLALPPADAERQLAKLPAKDVVNLRIDSAGMVHMGDKSIPAKKVSKVVADMIDENEFLVISIACDDQAQYMDFLQVLEGVKKGGAERIVIQLDQDA